MGVTWDVLAVELGDTGKITGQIDWLNGERDLAGVAIRNLQACFFAGELRSDLVELNFLLRDLLAGVGGLIAIGGLRELAEEGLVSFEGPRILLAGLEERTEGVERIVSRFALGIFVRNLFEEGDNVFLRREADNLELAGDPCEGFVLLEMPELFFGLARVVFERLTELAEATVPLLPPSGDEVGAKTGTGDHGAAIDGERLHVFVRRRVFGLDLFDEITHPLIVGQVGLVTLGLNGKDRLAFLIYPQP